VKFSIEGNLRDQSFCRIVMDLIREKATGILTVSCSTDTVVILFEFGMCVGVESHYPREELRLGHMLLNRNLLQLEQLEESLEEQKKVLVKLGCILVQKGFVSPSQIIDVLENQMLLYIYPCLTWTKGIYHYRSEEMVHYEREYFRPIDLMSLVEVGEDILKDQEWIGDRIPDVFSIPVLLPGLEVFPPGVQIKNTVSDGPRPILLTPEQEKIYNLVNGILTVRELIDTCNQFEYCSIIALIDLLDLGVVAIPILQESHEKTINKYSEYIKPLQKGLPIIIGVIALLIILKFVSNRVFQPTSVQTQLAELLISTRAKMDQLRFVLAVYAFMNEDFPDYLSDLINAKMIREKDLLDCWGSKYYYRHSKTGYILASVGPDLNWATNDDITIEGSLDEYSNSCFHPVWLKKSE
jgi:hypothetical protein